MRQLWKATWETPQGEKKEHQFTCFHFEEIARIAFEQELQRRGEDIPRSLTLERMGEPYELPHREPEPILKTLYCMVYNTETPNPTTRTLARSTFFYAVDKVEAHRIAEEKKRKMVGPVYIEEIKAYPQGFTIMREKMQGKMLFTPDGKPYEQTP
jgi:hypothetical protein